jgi:site-specific DNA recombinase
MSSFATTKPVRLRGSQSSADPTPVRVAIYTRKSVEASSREAYNSLEAQRDSALRFISIKKEEGWDVLPQSFDDNGFTGANTERPGYKALCAAVVRGEVDVVAIYKLDRITRSQKDLHAFLGFLREHGVDLVSVTQHFDTTTPHGRAMIGILGTFSELERETTAERTRDKVAEARRKGHWTGGRVPFGYTVKDKQLEPLPEEAERVRDIFRLYLELGSLRAVVAEAHRRGWRTKTWTNQEGKTHHGRAIDKSWLHRLLRSPIYIGKMTLKGEVFEGRHEAIVDEDIWDRVQHQLSHNDHTRGKSVRNKWDALLKGLLHCGRCDATMGHTYTAKGPRRYRYYVCQTAQQRGCDACPDARVAAKDIEDAVVAQIRDFGTSPDLVRLTVAALRERGGDVAGERVAKALGDFDDLWGSLPTLQKTEVLTLLLDSVTFRPDDRTFELALREPVLFEQADDDNASE